MVKEPMVSRTVLMPLETYRRVNAYAEAQELSWSAAVRRLVDQQLDFEDGLPVV